MKRPFLTLDQAREIIKTYPTPFHIYDEKGIRATARSLRAAFAWNPGFSHAGNPEAPAGRGMRGGLFVPHGADDEPALRLFRT